jgi:hypothetical protein
MSSQAQNVFEAILRFGHDEDFRPQVRENWQPTDAVAGTSQKVDILRHRVELGVPLFHPHDNPECVCLSNVYQTKTPVCVVKVRHHRGALLSE